MSVKEWKTRVRELKPEAYALYLCLRHPGTPWYAKLFAWVIVGYALSPVDLIPDFIPIIGYVDDLILIPAGMALLIKMIPKDVLEECRLKARSAPPPGKTAGLIWAFAIVSMWALAIYFLVRFMVYYIWE